MVQAEKLRLLEAALYVAGRPLDLKTLSSIIDVEPPSEVLRLARILAEKYKGWNTAPEVLELSGRRFVLQLKPEYTRRVKRVSFKPVPTEGELKTLSYIALNQPVSQKKIAQVRGSQAYRHLKRLEKLNLITRRDKGRTKIVTTTDYFADCLGLSRNITIMKRQLKNILRKMGETKN